MSRNMGCVPNYPILIFLLLTYECIMSRPSIPSTYHPYHHTTAFFLAIINKLYLSSTPCHGQNFHAPLIFSPSTGHTFGGRSEPNGNLHLNSLLSNFTEKVPSLLASTM